MRGRIRTIKPDFFVHEKLFEAEQESGLPLRVAFAGLFTQCDREGRFEWRPRRLKLFVLPYDDVDFGVVLDELCRHQFIVSYEVERERFGAVPTWLEHQRPNAREACSVIPPPELLNTHVHTRAHTCNAESPSAGVNMPQPIRETVLARDGHACVRCGSKKDLTVDQIFPKLMGGTHALTNLRTLCISCSSARPVAGQALIDDLAKDGLTCKDMQRTCTHVQEKAEGEWEGEGNDPTDHKRRDAAPTVWDVGREILGGGLFGKQFKIHSEDDIKAAIVETMNKQPGDPKSYLLGVLKNGGNKNGKANSRGHRPNPISEFNRDADQRAASSEAGPGDRPAVEANGRHLRSG